MNRFYVGSFLSSLTVLNEVAHRLSFPDLLRRNVVLGIVSQLLFPSAIGLVNGCFHAWGNVIRIHDSFAINVPGCSANCLGQATLIAQEAFLVGIENGNKRDFRQVKTFAQKIHAYEHIELAHTQLV